MLTWVVRMSWCTPHVPILFPPVVFSMQLFDRGTGTIPTSLLVLVETIFTPLVRCSNVSSSQFGVCEQYTM